MERLRIFWRKARRARRRPTPARRRRPTVDGLEGRQLLSAPGTPVTLLSAAPTDGNGVLVSYRVEGPGDPGGVVNLAVYRSADDRLDPADPLVGRAEVAATPGLNQSTVEPEGGLPPRPGFPYVIVAAGPPTGADQGADAPPPLASFRTRSMAVVVHGGVQNQSWKNGPPWQLVMARTLGDQGYDVALPFNWVSESTTPGAAPRQGRRLANLIVETAGAFPPGEPIDVHLIGHSEGAVVVTQALRLLGPSPTPELGEGYLRVTLLDPYSASNGVPGQNASFGGPLGWIAKAVIDNYQSRADDPPVVVPGWVDGAEVIYQQTPASKDHGTNNHIYNLWGQVPVRGVSVYYDLTPASVTHSGKTGVAAWYQRHVVPTLGDGAPGLAEAVLAAAYDGGTFAGRAAPGVSVRLLAAPADSPDDLAVAGRTRALADGSWALTPRLRPGHYRVVARSAPEPGPSPPRIPVVSTATLGLVVVNPQRQRRASNN